LGGFCPWCRTNFPTIEPVAKLVFWQKWKIFSHLSPLFKGLMHDQFIKNNGKMGVGSHFSGSA
jgi:hypothetical protein